MSAPYLDCSNEVSAMRDPGDDRLVWLAPDIGRADYLLPIDDAAQDEIGRLLDYFETNPLPLLERRLDELALPACRALMARMKSILDDGVGFAVLDRLDLGQHPVDSLLQVYWLLGQAIGRLGR